MTINEPDREKEMQRMTGRDAQPAPGGGGHPDPPEPVDRILGMQEYIRSAYGEPVPLDDAELRRNPACPA
jgi:hypothetical protein